MTLTLTPLIPTPLSVTPSSGQTFTYDLMRLLIPNDDDLSLEVGFPASSGLSNLARGLVTPNVGLHGLAVFHRKHTEEFSSPAADGGSVVAQNYVEGFTPTALLDYCGVRADTRSDVEGTNSAAAATVAIWGEGLIGGGVTKGRGWGGLFEVRQVLNVSATGAVITRGSDTVTGLSTTTGVSVGMYVGDTNSDAIPDNTTVAEILSSSSIRMSQAAVVDGTEVGGDTLRFTNTNGQLVGLEVAGFNYAAVTGDRTLPAAGGFAKYALRVASRGSTPLTAFVIGDQSKVGALNGFWMVNVAEKHFRAEVPGRPGCVGLYVDQNNTSVSCDTTSASADITRNGGTAFPATFREGMLVSGNGILGNTVIDSISADGLTVTLSKPAAKSQTNQTLRFTNWRAGSQMPYNVWHQAIESDGTIRNMIGLDHATGLILIGDPGVGGASPAGTGVALPNNIALYGINAARDSFEVMLRLTTANKVSLGNTGVDTILNGATIVVNNLTQFTDGINIVLGTTTGTKIGQGTTQKVAFHGSTPVIQRAGADQAAVATTAATNTTPYGFTTVAQADAIVALVNELRAALVEKGLIKGAA